MQISALSLLILAIGTHSVRWTIFASKRLPFLASFRESSSHFFLSSPEFILKTTELQLLLIRTPSIRRSTQDGSRPHPQKLMRPPFCFDASARALIQTVASPLFVLSEWSILENGVKSVSSRTRKLEKKRGRGVARSKLLKRTKIARFTSRYSQRTEKAPFTHQTTYIAEKQPPLGKMRREVAHCQRMDGNDRTAAQHL